MTPISESARELLNTVRHPGNAGSSRGARMRHDPSMIEEPSARGAPKGDIDYRLLVPFLAHVTLIQTLSLIIRITTSYRAIELGLPVLWLGIIATGFAIIPVFTALQVGRWIDRGNDARATWLGSALVFTACIGFWAWPRSAMYLLGFSVLLGFGHMFCMAGHPILPPPSPPHPRLDPPLSS